MVQCGYPHDGHEARGHANETPVTRSRLDSVDAKTTTFLSNPPWGHGSCAQWCRVSHTTRTQKCFVFSRTGADVKMKAGVCLEPSLHRRMKPRFKWKSKMKSFDVVT